MQKKHISITIVSVVVLVAILFLMHEPLLLVIGNFLVIKDNLQPADVIHVIAGQDYRTDYAIQLYEQGYGRQLFFTGGWCQFHNYFHGRHAKERALEQGIPGEAIAIDESQVMSTYSEAVRLKEFIDQNQAPIHSIIIVSDPYHMRRARWTYRQVFGDQIILEMAPVPFELSPHTRRWWTEKESMKMVWEEYLKILYYYVRHRLASGSIKDWLSVLDKY